MLFLYTVIFLCDIYFHFFAVNLILRQTLKTKIKMFLTNTNENGTEKNKYCLMILANFVSMKVANDVKLSFRLPAGGSVFSHECPRQITSVSMVTTQVQRG